MRIKQENPCLWSNGKERKERKQYWEGSEEKCICGKIMNVLRFWLLHQIKLAMASLEQ
jgi:hypothetical protein